MGYTVRGQAQYSNLTKVETKTHVLSLDYFDDNNLNSANYFFKNFKSITLKSKSSLLKQRKISFTYIDHYGNNPHVRFDLYPDASSKKAYLLNKVLLKTITDTLIIGQTKTQILPPYVFDYIINILIPRMMSKSRFLGFCNGGNGYKPMSTANGQTI